MPDNAIRTIQCGCEVDESWPAVIVFDLDGTLVDSSGDLTASLNEVLAEHKLRPFEVAEAVKFVGDGIRMLVKRGFLARQAGLSKNELRAAVNRFHAVYRRHLTGTTKPNDGVIEIVAAIKARGVRIGVCTNKAEDLALRIIDKLGLGRYVDVVVGSRPGRPLKPSPIPLIDTLSRLGVPSADAIMVGDSHVDVQCARAAGLPVVCVSFGYSRTPVHELGADIVIDSFAEFDAACQALKAMRA